MKVLSVLIFTIAFALPVLSSAQNLPTKEIVVGVNDVFVPTGQTSYQDAYVVASGLFSNGCYSYKEARVNLNTETRVHIVQLVADVSIGSCIRVIVPFTKKVVLGRLDQGTHTVRFVSHDETYVEKKLVIE